MATPRYTLAADGYFQRDGKRFVPVGVNWWPGSCGVELWQQWPEAEIQHDLDVVANLGLNTVRFFLRWQDFEPRPGGYETQNFERLEQLLGWFAERDLAAHPALFVGFMSGGIFWPEWREGRNVFADPMMRERAAAFAGQAMASIVRYADTVIAIDQGNELCCLPDSREAPPAAVRGWCASVNAAIREVWPEATIISGNEQNQIVNDSGWRLDDQPGCDLLSMHAYPVPNWHPIPFDGMRDPLCQSLLPLYTRIARAFAPVMVQEFGTIVTYGREPQERYLSAILPACLEAGSNGFLWWCLRDISAPVLPYLTNGFEGSLGLIDANDQVKPGLETFVAFAKTLAAGGDGAAAKAALDAAMLSPIPSPTAVKSPNLAAPAAPPSAARGETVGLYFPRFWWHRDSPGTAGKNASESGRRTILANYLLRQAGHATVIVRGDLPLPSPADGPATILVPSLNLRVDEVEALTAWVTAGGHLIWHGVDPVNWGPAYVALLGAAPVDYRAVAGPRQVQVAGESWDFHRFPRNLRCEVDPRGAEVLAADQDGNPVLIRHTVGAGVVVAAFPCVEESPAGLSDKPVPRDRWTAWYTAVLAAAAAHSA